MGHGRCWVQSSEARGKGHGVGARGWDLKSPFLHVSKHLCPRPFLWTPFSLAVPGLGGGRYADLVGDVRQPCKPQTAKMSGPLALHFQPQASADEGPGPCGPLARG